MTGVKRPQEESNDDTDSGDDTDSTESDDLDGN